MERYVMTRKGSFSVTSYTNNQCGEVGTKIYEYKVDVIFNKHSKLDHEGFVIENGKINKLITSLDLKGSCEEMHENIHKGLRRMFIRENVRIVALRTTIYAYNNPPAYISLVWYLKGLENLFPLLNG